MIHFPCQEVYLLNLYERQDKFDKMMEKLGYMGINVIPFRTVKHPFYDKIVSDIKHKTFGINNNGVFSCTREHYTIIKGAYLRGLSSVGIMEDDCSFLKDKLEWEKHFNNLPNDWDVLRVNCLRGGHEEWYDENKFWLKTERNISGTGFYILNRKAMEYIISFIDNIYVPIDYPLEYANNKGHLNIYLPKNELSLCIEDEKTWSSDIRKTIDEPHKFYLSIKRFNKDNYI